MKYFLISLIKIYQKCISPYLMPSCRYYPTCSEYMINAINTFGIFKGLQLGIYRILRCCPFSKYGYDPIPKKSKMEDNDATR